ncbi:MAG: phosphoribosyltransferase family protein [Cyanobacteria bacterium P01_A01_bin.83]
MNGVFANRRSAGKKLAHQLASDANYSQALVLGLPRGGIPVAYEIAKHLHLPLDVCLVKKIGLPNQPEVAVGAISEAARMHNDSGNGNITIIDADTANRNSVEKAEIYAAADQVKADLKWRQDHYRQYRPLIKIRDRTVILVDDGMATGLTMHAAIAAVRQQQPQKIILAIPVAANKALQQLDNLVDDHVCLLVPKSLNAVSFWYEDFSQVSDQEVCNLLSQSNQTVVI